jgi:hypothetical protein
MRFGTGLGLWLLGVPFGLIVLAALFLGCR